MTSLKQTATTLTGGIADQSETRSSRWSTLHCAQRFMLLIGICIVTAMSCHPARAATEAEVKAAFIYNFARFVEWPPQAFPSGDTPLTIGVVGGQPVADALDQLTRGKTIDGRRLSIRRVSVDNLDGCQILFIGASEKGRTNEILDRLRDASVVTVGETSGFIQSGGIIGFVIENNRVAFEINAGAAKRKHLKISSQLLKLAKNVRG